MEQNNYRDKEQDRRIEWLEKHYSNFNTEMGSVKQDVSEIKTDVAWLKKFFWVVVAASIGSVIANLFNLLAK